MNPQDYKELQNFRQQRAKQLYNKRLDKAVHYRVAAARRADKRQRVQAKQNRVDQAAPTTAGTAAVGAGAGALGAATIYGRQHGLNQKAIAEADKTNYKHSRAGVKEHYNKIRAENKKIFKTNIMDPEFYRDRRAALKSADKYKNVTPKVTKGLKLAGKAGLGALAVGGLAAAGSYGLNKLRQWNEKRRPA